MAPPEFDDEELDSEALPQPEPAHASVDSIVACVENRHFEIGIACLRMSDHSVELSQFCDDQAYSKALSFLQRHEPRRLLFPPSASESVFEKVVQSEFGLTCRVVHIPRRNWNESKGMEFLRHYSHRSQLTTILPVVSKQYLSLAALCALIEVVEHEGTTFVKGTLRIEYKSVEGVMLLDPATVANLEILRNLRTGDSKASLFGMLNLCKTAAGTRYLRSSLIQPSTHLDTISARLDCVSELVEKEDALLDAQKVLSSFADSDRLLKFFMVKPTQGAVQRAKAAVSAVLQLKTALRTAPLLADALTSTDTAPPANELLQAVVANLRSAELAGMEARIEAVIDEEAAFKKKTSQRMFECLFAVRPKVCSFLDVTRQTLHESIHDMEELAVHYADELGLTDLKLVWTERRGYHLTLPVGQKEIVQGAGFIQISSQSKKTVACSTEQLAQFSMRAKEMIQQILVSTEAQLEGLIGEIRHNLHVLFRLGESVALVDTMCAFASFVRTAGGPYVRPKMGEGCPLVLKQCRHPLLEHLGDVSVVPNDVGIFHASNFQLVTGPNMAGARRATARARSAAGAPPAPPAPPRARRAAHRRAVPLAPRRRASRPTSGSARSSC